MFPDCYGVVTSSRIRRENPARRALSLLFSAVLFPLAEPPDFGVRIDMTRAPVAYYENRTSSAMLVVWSAIRSRWREASTH
jgi:hypothetical protein